MHRKTVRNKYGQFFGEKIYKSLQLCYLIVCVIHADFNGVIYRVSYGGAAAYLLRIFIITGSVYALHKPCHALGISCTLAEIAAVYPAL